VGKFHGFQFLWFSWISYYLRKLDPRNKYKCIKDMSVRVRKKFEDWPSAKFHAILYYDVSCVICAPCKTHNIIIWGACTPGIVSSIRLRCFEWGGGELAIK
jgi:hypothetical protein